VGQKGKSYAFRRDPTRSVHNSRPHRSTGFTRKRVTLAFFRDKWDMGQNRDRFGTKSVPNYQNSPEFSTTGQLWIRSNYLFSPFNFFHKYCGTPAHCAGQRDTEVNPCIYNNKVSHSTVPLGTVGTDRADILTSSARSIHGCLLTPQCSPRTKRTTSSRERSSNLFTSKRPLS
jgi:hypothetical protein